MKGKSFKYYIGTFLMVLIFMIMMCFMSHLQGNYVVSSSLESSGVWAKEISIFLYKDKTFVLGNYLLDVLAVVVLPFFFCLVFFGVDKLSNLLKGKKRREKEAEEERYDEFIDSIGTELNKMKSFNPEDFRHFRENEKFQECLKRLYYIYKDGETESCNYQLLLRKFPKASKEKEALENLIAFTEKRRLTERKEN